MASLATLSVLLLLLIPLSTLIAQAQRNITSGSLTAGDRNPSWKSPSGDFAFGFMEVAGDGFLLAIWFDKIPEKTVIWSANGDNLSRKGSRVELTLGGGFILSDPNGKETWAAQRDTVSHASMLDTGNFVLVDRSGSTLWESFRHPTDTMVPAQVLDRNTKLVSRYSNTNYSTGRFELNMQFDGNLVLLTHLPVFDVLNAYWSTKTINTGHQVVFNRTGQIYVTSLNGSVISTVMSGTVSSSEGYYQRAILEYDGVFRQYVYPRNSCSCSSGRVVGWSMISSPVPENMCTSMRQTVSAGACGYNSYCILGDDQRPTCKCPPGYSFMDPSNDMNGCKQDFLPQSCQKGVLEPEPFTLQSMVNADWPNSDYEHYYNQNEEFCRQACLDDCLCDVAIFRNGECWKKRMPLSNGRVDASVGGVALIKTRIDNSTSDRPLGGPKPDDRRALIIIGSAILSSSLVLNLFLLLLACVIWFRYRHRAEQSAATLHQSCNGMNNGFTGMRSFTYKELEEATSGFKEKLGQGAFGAVYRGALPSSLRGMVLVAVKVLEKVTSDGEREFKTEVDTIGRTNHRNLVELIGFCNEGQHRLLVYEFMPKGSLANFLFGGGSRPSWFKRIEIAYGVARGLLYLHEECSKQIIHCDIKPQNILLDESLTAKICDFGLAKLLMTDQTRTLTGVRGTKGYLAPEWFRNMPVSVKVDVYSFGILLLELICCRKSCDFEMVDEARMVLSDWVYDCYHEDRLDEIVVGDEEAAEDMKRVRRFVMIAMWCIQEDPSLRPPMKKVAQMLDGAVEVAIPPEPSSFISSL